LTTRVRFDPPKYDDDALRLRTVESILDRLSAVPGVTAAAAMRAFPIVEGEPRRQFAIGSRTAPQPGSAPWAMEAATFGDYGRAISLPLLEGRSWTAADRASSWAVALVNREAVRRYWPSQSPVGERITMVDASGQPDGRAIEIVGVVDNVLGSELSEPPPPRLYRPLAAASPLTSVALAIRVSGDATVVATAIRASLRAEDPDLAASELRLARRQLDNTLRTDDQIAGYYAQAAQAIGADVPFVIQDYPLTFSVQMTPAVIRRIVQDNVQAKRPGGAHLVTAVRTVAEADVRGQQALHAQARGIGQADRIKRGQ
jgi:hypothetical protein